jgi:acetyl esterase/lipase
MFKPQYHEILTVPWLAKVLNQLIMSSTGTPREPLLIANGESDGTGDGLVPIADVRALARTYCQRGVPVQFQVYKGLDHEDATAPFEAHALGFLTERLAGRPVADGCNSIGQGGSLAPPN